MNLERRMIMMQAMNTAFVDDVPRVAPTTTPAAGATPAPALPQRQALYMDVAEALRQRIFAGELAPGAWVDEMHWAQVFGISRTPLREALKVLAAEGLVAMRPRRGAYVAEISAADAQHIYRLLALLEADATAELAASITDTQLGQLAELHGRLMQQLDQHDAFFATNEAFHMTVLHLAGNRWRQQIVADLRKAMKLARHHSLFKAGRMADALDEHASIMAALQARDPELARSLVMQHFEQGLQALSSQTLQK
jgi:DNA-binding GntR family transcriptional regulator